MKKILSMLLSLALVSASFVTAMAEAKPYASFEIEAADATVLETCEYEELPTDTNYYKVTVNFNNLPDLTYGSSGAGVRLGTFNLKFYTDASKIKGVYGVNATEAEDYELEEGFGLLDVSPANIKTIAAENCISVVKAITEAKQGYPYKKAQATNDVDGVLASALVFYVAADEEPVFTSVFTDANIDNESLEDVTNTMVTEFFGAAEEYVNSDASYNVGVEKKQTVTSAVNEAVFEFLAADGTEAEYTVSFTTVESGSVAVALNVTNVPAGVTFQYTGATIQ